MDGEARDLLFVRKALALAARAARAGEAPAGAVAVVGDRIVGSGRNRREARGDPTAHAEIEAIRRAAKSVGDWRLNAVTLYVSKEPCVMCAGALVLARVGRVVYAADDAKGGGCGGRIDIPGAPGLNHRVKVEGGLLAEEAAVQLRTFFRRRREKGHKPE